MIRALFFLLLLFQAACTTVQEVPDSLNTGSWQAHKASLDDMNHWFATGRAAINNGSESWHVNLLWLQQGDDYKIRLFGPFGAGQVQITGNEEQSELQTSDDERFYSTDIDTLLYARTGVKMPVAELRYWLLGLPSPGSKEAATIDKHGRLSQLKQGDWRVRYKRYMPVNGLVLPRKIFADKQDLDVRVVIDEWKLGPATTDNPFNEKS
ncbi:MAG: lipoprotein insertase outer membrane protein LolB [Gammaproteobacteria bacterium]|nr:lipoprotein insertase outer membrane protein LolB [Gammaproteobacteria bacterium]